MKKRIISIMCVAVVLITSLVVPVGAETIVQPPPQVNQMNFGYSAPYLVPSSSIVGPLPEGQRYYIQGAFTIREDLQYLRFDRALFGYPDGSGWLIVSGVQRDPVNAPDLFYGLYYSIAGEILVKDGFAISLSIDPDDDSKFMITGLYMNDPVGRSLIWDSQNGFVEQAYRNVSFSQIRQEISSTAWYLLSAILEPAPWTYEGEYGNVYDGQADFTTWLFTAVMGFMNFEIAHGITIGTMLGAIVGFSLCILLLKFFAGG